MDNDDSKKIISANCRNCGGRIDIDETKETAVCEFCGTKYSVDDLINESDEIKAQKIKSQTYKEVEMEKLKHKVEADKRKDEKDEIESFKKGKFSKVLLIAAGISFLMCCVGFSDGRTLAGVIALVQTALFIVAWLIGMRIVKVKMDNLHFVLAIIGFVLLILYSKAYSSSDINADDYIENMEMSEIQWPDSEIAKLLPVPKSKTGNFIRETSEGFSVYLGDTSKKQYDDYVKACSKKGFKENYSKDEKYYRADNKEGYHISLDYEGHNIMLVSIDAPEKESKVKESTKPKKETKKKESEKETSKSTKSTKATDGVSKDFKKLMDSYEKFFDEYIVFMKKYKDSNNSISIAKDYAEYLKKYTDTMKKIEDIDEDELSDADMAYYLKVTTRINKKLSEIE